jgi:hypothetical protein
MGDNSITSLLSIENSRLPRVQDGYAHGSKVVFVPGRQDRSGTPVNFIQARRLEVNGRRFWHGQQFHDAFLPSCKPQILLDRPQHVGWASVVRDDDGALFRSLLSPACVPIEFPGLKAL